MTTPLFVIEDQAPILKNLLRVLSGFSSIQLLGHATNGEDALCAIQALNRLPEVILCDLGLPGISGIDVTKRIKQNHPSIEVLILTIFEEEDQILKAIHAGASGYLLKGASGAKIVDAIQEVKEGGSVIQPSLAKKILKYFKMPLEGNDVHEMIRTEEKRMFIPKRLTERELECLQMVAKGLSNNETAGVLGLSKATIRTHLEHIYQKLDVTNRVEAVTEGLRQGIIEI